MSRRTDLIKKMTDLDEFFLTYIHNRQRITVQGTVTPGKREVRASSTVITDNKHVSFYCRDLQKWINVPVVAVRGIKGLSTVLNNA